MGSPERTQAMDYTGIDNEAIWNRLGDDHPVVGPVSGATIDRLLRMVELKSDATVLDIGCGLGAWSLRALELHPGSSCVGVDLSAAHIARATREAERRGLADRFSGHAVNARAFTPQDPSDLVMCVGLTEVFGGLDGTLKHLRAQVLPNGYVLLGESFWHRPPNEQTLAALSLDEDPHTDLNGVLEQVTAAGWMPVHAQVSTAEEWDNFLWACVRGLVDWGFNEQDPAARTRILRYTSDYRESWLHNLRGTLGFVLLLLRPVAPSETFLVARRPEWAR
ncbi:SAM-dependent methyltransferase [Nocardiopsis ansamitocini]|uniref:SAM-dependent methyltransferase n=1 Tax=Nocardiopsis ansamitocini TaxID=1670832 RepID=A0A9W6PAJ1_9ACTN|nr:class I SAM-dependent methyltransferase [Nocardiopsis ansamitocini]GLU50034.1 SAM-dependent methyltransferase [Nocardiopsis ansamitocini]